MSSEAAALNQLLLALRERLTLTRYADRLRLSRDLDRLFSRRAQHSQAEAGAAALEKAIQQSADKVARLRELPLRIEFDPALPISAHREEIAAAITKHPVTVICGATGSGKTTQLPKICLEAGRGTFGLI